MLLLLTGTTGPHAEALRCDKVASLLNSQEELAAQYPACVGSPETYVAVSTHGWAPENDAAAATAVFGTCLMFSLLAHIFATEIYVSLGAWLHGEGATAFPCPISPACSGSVVADELEPDPIDSFDACRV